MQTQIRCPQCQTPFMAQLHQIVDVGLNPGMKDALLNGQLNVAQCPNCGAVTQIASPMLYHDPEHELFMVHVPTEMSLPHDEQEKLIGTLVQRAMDQLPPEKRRGYMFSPQTILRMQTFMEKVLETEGVTPEMMAHQRRQMELLQALATADKETTDRLLKERMDDIDEVFFSMLRANMESAENSNQEQLAIQLINLQAKLYRDTEYGRKLSERQRALHAFSRDAKQDGLSPELLLKHVIDNRNDPDLVNSLVMNGQQAFNYEFFTKLTEKIEKRQKAGASVDQYIALRERLLEAQEAIEKRSREMLNTAQQTLDKIMQAKDRGAAVRENVQHIDDAFMYVLSSYVEQAQKRNNQPELEALQEIQAYIMQAYSEQLPPEIRLINNLLDLDTAEQKRLLEENKALVGPELLEMIKAVRAENQDGEGKALSDRLAPIQAMVESQLALA